MNISNVIDVPMSDIKLQGSNVRSDLDSPNSQENLKELAENIKINGLLQPILLRGIQGRPPYDVIVGQRRFLANQILNSQSIKASFSGDVDNMQALLLSLSENMCRQDMNFEDTQDAITKLYNHYGNEYKVKEHTGFSIKMIRSHIKIKDQATDKIKKLLNEDKISLADAKRAIDASQGDNEKADILIEEIAKLTTYEKKRLVESGAKNPSAKAEDLIKEARQPKLDEALILYLPRKVKTALSEASLKLNIDMEELTLNTLVSWLKTNDYLVE